ncbi:MAG TPA: hypothetical protein VG984_01605 [Candidatus Paceibacterota bacterium]|nr:hypothetical protein [Candidatus Paceibacterota bacterium]
MTFRRIAALIIAPALVVGLPLFALAQNAPYSQVIISTQTIPGTPAPSIAPIVYVNATTPSMAGIPNVNNSTISYASAFNNDVRTVTFTPGSYNVVATVPAGYYASYSPDCTGFTPLSGAIRSCTILLSNVPPQTGPACPQGWVSNGSFCVQQNVQYQGSTAPSTLSCAPSYQSIGAGQAATFTATGGTGSYNWTTATRTSLNVGPSYTTVFQTSGPQTVIVSSGTQTANCTITVGSVNGPITYSGSGTYTGGNTYTYANGNGSYTYTSVAPTNTTVATNYTGPVVTYTTVSNNPSVTASYVPASLPNTGFEPQNGAALALALVFLIGASIFAAPYVRQAFAVALR